MQRVEKGKRLKQRGADFMKAKDFRRACWVYLGPKVSQLLSECVWT